MEGIRGSLRGQVEIEGHLAIGGGGIVGEFEELASEGCDCCFCLDRHCCLLLWMRAEDVELEKVKFRDREGILKGGDGVCGDTSAPAVSKREQSTSTHQCSLHPQLASSSLRKTSLSNIGRSIKTRLVSAKQRFGRNAPT